MIPLSKKARLAGLLYVLTSLLGIVRLMYIPKTLIVSGDATATANNIAAHELLFRFGIAADLLGGVMWLFVALTLYRLLKDVDQQLAQLMVILSGLMITPIFFLNTLNDAATLLFATGSSFLSVFDKPQRDAFATLFLRLHHQGILANEIFWGLWLLPFGLLVYRSRFLPRVLGVWVMIACFSWLALGFTGVLIPQYEDMVYRIGQPVALGEVAMMLWLLIMGAKEHSPAQRPSSRAAAPTPTL
jgi:hypothetical protein